MLDRKSPLPLYYQLAEQLKEQIELGQIKPGDKLLSESEMMELYGIGRPTIRHALAQLVNEGYLEKQHGTGTFCCQLGIPGKRLSIDVILELADTYFIPYYIKGISLVLEDNECDFLIKDSRNDTTRIRELLEDIIDKGSSGVILQPSHLDKPVPVRLKDCFRRMRNAGIPYIMIDSTFEGVDASFVIMDEYEGGRLAADYLSQLGHRRLAMAYMDTYKYSLLRLAGFTDNCKQSGMPQPIRLKYGLELKDNLIQIVKQKEATALFFDNDEAAAEYMHYLKGAGFCIPRDVSVLGFDDSIITTMIDPPLTSIAHPKQSMGELAARALIEIINKKRPWPYMHIYKPYIVERYSCSRLADR